MDNQQKIEIYEKALYIVKETGKKDGIYCHLEKNGLDIYYSEWDDLISIYWKINLVMIAKGGKIVRIIDDTQLWPWVDIINKEFRNLIKKGA